MSGLLSAIHARSEALSSATSRRYKSQWGQFFTPPEIAAFMAGLVEVQAGQDLRVLDPGAGTGILGAALARSALERGARSVQLYAVEAEPDARAETRRALDLLEAELGPRFQGEWRGDDLLDLEGTDGLPPLDVVIGNPPYFKISPSNPRGGDAPNAYARFMEVCARLLAPGGQMVFIVPRSFASGLYFQRFRRRLHGLVSLEAAHVFGSRREAFEGVLQESVIVRYRRGPPARPSVAITASSGVRDLDRRRRYEAPRELVLDPDDPGAVMALPTSVDEAAALRTVRAWPGRLADLGLAISTGPVVPFRTGALAQEAGPYTAPLLWMRHVQQGEVRWPLSDRCRKPEHLRLDAGEKLLVPNQTLVLLRRFSAKEERRRLTVAVLRGGDLPGDWIGLENHLNYIHRPGGRLDEALATGLAALLSSELIDTWFRVHSGNTQVSATEIRALPLPDEAALRERCW